VRGPRVVLFLALAVLLAASRAHAARAVHRGGEVRVDDEFVVDADAGVLRKGDSEEPLALFYLVESEDGKLLWAPRFASRMRGYELIAREECRETLPDLISDAVSARAPTLARSLLGRAQRVGIDTTDAQKLLKKIEYLEKRGSRGGPTAKAAEVEARAAELDLLLPNLLLQRALVEEESSPERVRLLLEALRVHPELAEAKAALDALKPPDFPFGDARTWALWKLEVESRGGAFASDDEFELKRTRAVWRKDLYGVSAGPVLLVTPVHDPVLVGRCVAVGQLTDRILEGMFAAFPVRRKEPRPMTVLLFENRKEYLAVSGTGRRIEPGDLDWSSGYYDPAESMSHFYWYRDPDSERRILGTCVHELTHHWLQERNPAYLYAETRSDMFTPGYWIVEGFATFMQEGSYDIDTGHFDLDVASAESLDVVATLAERDVLVPWRDLYSLNQAGFSKLDNKDTIPLVRRWALGRTKTSPARLFYDQAAATVQYLYHANEGRYRNALLRYVIDQYTGDKEALDVAKAFHVTPEELGRSVIRYAAARSRG